jgi:hypothetical protein
VAPEPSKIFRCSSSFALSAPGLVSLGAKLGLGELFFVSLSDEVYYPGPSFNFLCVAKT